MNEHASQLAIEGVAASGTAQATTPATDTRVRNGHQHTDAQRATLEQVGHADAPAQAG